MSEKKCKMCGELAEFEWDGCYYCEFCLCDKLGVRSIGGPSVCEQCGNCIVSRWYYKDSEDNAFCSAKCALEYNEACEIEEEQEDNVQEEDERK